MLIEYRLQGHGVFRVIHKGEDCGALVHENGAWRATVELPGYRSGLAMVNASRHKAARALVLMREALSLGGHS